ARADQEIRRDPPGDAAFTPRVGGVHAAARRVRAGGGRCSARRGRRRRERRRGGGLNGNWKDQGREIFRPIGKYLAARGAMPDHLTVLGVALSFLAAMFLARGSFLVAGLVLPLAGLCDVLDGDVARERGIASPFGAFLDSTLDRGSEGALYVGLAYYYFTRIQTATVWMRGTFEGTAEWGGADGATLGILALAILILSFLV